MEHISLSLPRRSFSSNSAFTSHKSVYDDVFGGPPKLGLPTLAPRFEDYSEIFGGFHTSQSSSIPFLHLPFLDSDDPDIHFDIDYTEVFGGCGGFNLTASPEDLVGQSSGGYDSDSPDEPWSPAQSVPLSDELDPVAGSDKSHILSDVGSQQSLASINKQNASYNKSSHMSAETVLTSTSHVGNLSAIPGYAFSLYESPSSWDGEDEHCPAGMINNINYSSRHGARVIGEKQYECSSNPVYSGSDIHRSDSKLVEQHETSTSVRDKPFVTVSDINLRTKPSRLPPPSRPPPVLVDKKRECVRVADGNNPLFFDMETDGTIAMEGRESGNKNVKANHQGTTELNEIKYFRSLSAAEVEEKTNETVRVAIDIEDENSLQPCGEKNTVLDPIVEEKIDSIKHIKEISVPLGAVCCENTAETVAWRESTEYFELQAEAKCYENEVEVRLKQQDSPKQTKIRFVDSQKLKETNGKNDEKILMEEFHRRFEDVDGAEMREIVQERMVAERTEKDMDMEAEKMIMHELASRKALEQAINDKYHKLSHEVDVINKRNQDVSKNENEVLRFKMAESENGEETFQTTGNMKVSTVACSREENHKLAEETDSIDSNTYDEREVEWELDDIVITEGDQLKILEGGFEVNDVTATKVSEKHDIIETLKSDQTAFSSAGNVELRNKPKINNAQFSGRVNISYNNCEQVKTESVVSGGKMEDVSSCLKHNSDGLYSKKDATNVHSERKDSNTRGNLSREDRGGIRRETVPENEHMRKIEEEREREREREKDRMAVDKAALEARERSYFEARERAERAAVERATAEVRKRAFAEAQERLEKASIEARLRSDRAAVERATAEARQRAAEKLMVQKAAHDSLDHVERLPDRFSNCLRYPYSSAHDGTESESPQRCKARLERYRRTAERAANALAEKNRRDHLAQREREERNRVAESLDTEVKRWSSGKEGNLRALLSTLQYILGPDSGWHPLSLTEVITSAAVKKAYRRATLCVHPDKLQQRGATIQQKYICEKVFDLLKEAWNKFNSEER